MLLDFRIIWKSYKSIDITSFKAFKFLIFFKNLFFFHDGRRLRPSKQFQANVWYIPVLGHPRKGKNSDLNNAKKCKLRREKL